MYSEVNEFSNRLQVASHLRRKINTIPNRYDCNTGHIKITVHTST